MQNKTGDGRFNKTCTKNEEQQNGWNARRNAAVAALWQRSLVSSQGDDQGKRERILTPRSITSHSKSKISHRGTYVAALIRIGDKGTKLTRTSYGFSIRSQNLRK